MRHNLCQNSYPAAFFAASMAEPVLARACNGSVTASSGPRVRTPHSCPLRGGQSLGTQGFALRKVSLACGRVAGACGRADITPARVVRSWGASRLCAAENLMHIRGRGLEGQGVDEGQVGCPLELIGRDFRWHLSIGLIRVRSRRRREV